VTLSDERTTFLINGSPFKSPDVPVLLQILNGVPASQLLPNGSIYPLEQGKSVEVSIPAGAPGGPVSLCAISRDRAVVTSRSLTLL